MRPWLTCLFLSIAVLVLSPSASEARSRDQMVTWTDFSHIRWIASSMEYTYFATTNGITKYNKFTSQWELPLTGGTGLDHHDLYRVWVDEFDRHLVANTGDGLYEYDDLLDRWYPLQGNRPPTADIVHVGAPDILYVPDRYTYSSNGQLNDRWGRSFVLSDIVDDGSGTLWMGTWGHGAAQAGSAAGIFEFMPFGLLQPKVDALMLYDGRIFTGGASFDQPRSGLTIFDPDKSSFEYLESGLETRLPLVDITCLAANDSLIFLGTDDGIYIIEQETHEVTDHFTRRSGLPDDYITSSLTSGDTLWVGTTYGLGVVTRQGDSTIFSIPAAFSSQVVFDMTRVCPRLWLATSMGAYRIDLETGEMDRIHDPQGILDGEVYAVADYDSDLWFVASQGAIRIRPETGDIESFPNISAFPDYHAMAVNDRVLAISVGNGLTLLYHDTRHRNQVHFTTADGLPSERIKSLVFDGDYLWIGSDRGLTRFWWSDPHRVD